jgi:transposase
MFLRTVKAKGPGGSLYEYVRLVESYRDELGRSQQRVVCNLGRKDLLAPHLDSLIRILRGESAPLPKRASDRGEVQALGAWDWGPVLVARRLWSDLGLQSILDRLSPPGSRRPRRDEADIEELPLADRAFALVANRLCAPSSEHALARWLETDFVCDRTGRRILPVWRDDAERKKSRAPRVRVDFGQLQQWYRTLDQLLARKSEIERELYLKLRDLFSLEVDLVFYDLTSTYFEGHGPPRLGAHGHSRDGKPRNRQVLVGLVMVDGWPLAHHVFAGNWRDAMTVPSVLEDLEKRFGLARVVFVGDRGMVTAKNLELLRSHKQGYVVGLLRRRSEEVFGYIQKATGSWIECPVGITSREKPVPPKTLVQEVDSGKPGVRVFVVHSDERLEFERARRVAAMERVRKRLEKLEKRVKDGKLKAAAKVGAAAQRILSDDHGHRYFGWEYEKGVFRFFEHPIHLKREQAYEGKYVIQTEEKALSPVDAVQVYKELSEVERAFSHLKDVIEMRPIFHRTDERVSAHVFVAALSFLLHRALERKLKERGLDLSATEALQALRTVRLVEFAIDPKTTRRSVTRGTERAARILNALDIRDLEPSGVPTNGKGAV